jgi:CubicO group peptidase (beta-lactamase class C family)
MQPGGSRSLPGRPNLRHLKVEAKRRAAAGEFPSLHEAQVAIAREHGLPTWATLKQRVSTEQESHAPAQLRWIIARFAGAADPNRTASDPDWPAPGDDELRQHFDDRFLSEIPPPALIATISKMAADLRDGELVILRQTPLQAYVELNGVQYIAVAEAEPPHRLSGLRGLPAGSRVRDQRIANAPVRTQGDVPAEVADIAEPAFAELGLTALVLAGGDAYTPTCVLARGWADLDRDEALDPAHRFPVPGATVLVTATAVLKLAADGTIGLDRRANEQLRSIRLADDTITVRDLLTHTAGVDNPTEMYADAVPDLEQLRGPVVGCTGPRGTVHPSNGGIAVLGQLAADVTGMPYAQAAAELVLNPLQLKDSSFPRAYRISTQSPATTSPLRASSSRSRDPRGRQPRRDRCRDQPHPRPADARRADQPPDPDQHHRGPPAAGLDQLRRNGESHVRAVPGRRPDAATR